MISMINTESKRILRNIKIKVFKDRSLLRFNLKLLSKHPSYFRIGYLIISIIQNTNIRNCKIEEIYGSRE